MKMVMAEKYDYAEVKDRKAYERVENRISVVSKR
jgi:hypothetical protein